MIELKIYKGVKIFFNESNSRLHFDFEEQERVVSYLFEAYSIIDEPRWETCNLRGFVVDGIFNDYIGLAKATKIDIKSGKPFWLIKDRYSMDYKQDNGLREVKVYPDTPNNRKVYNEWKAQNEIVKANEAKRKDIISKLELQNNKKGE